MYQQFINEFIQQENLPAAYRDDIERWFLPLTSELEVLRHQRRPQPLCLGINGAQGTGKSTLAALLVALLQTRGLHAVNVSLDDFYYGKAERQQLAAQVHPLLLTRGVPGTHDMQLALATLAALQQAQSGTRVALPAFDKASDDRVADEAWRIVTGPFDVIILEGWFVGAKPQSAAELTVPVNDLEATADADQRWRGFVNAQLAASYQTLFGMLDLLLMLQAPDFEQVYAWRTLQEQKLRAAAPKGTPVGMNADELARFIQHFERLTRHCLQTLPGQADIVFQLNEQHGVTGRSG